ncbi:type II toxin-antitoxin system Phd/YefM family antitoxin [Egbenema bharatensis]|uniref:type II toxin-antitoxin system Phd/YefM family antitoxin n=1 Tax=Egbenema bharatensis TaxID=3463334 RepID=UPI003A85E05F
MPDSISQYSIAHARDHLPQLVHQAEQGIPVELTRRGKRVAVILSAEEYDRLMPSKPNFWEGLVKFREQLLSDNIDIDPDEIFQDVRDKSPGRDFSFDE